MRYTRKFIEARFAMAMDAIGAPHGETWIDHKAQLGVHFIDHNSVYGGYVICCIHNQGGAETHPFGDSRYPASAFIALLDGVLGAARFMKRN